MRYEITLLDIVRGRSVTYLNYELADDEAAVDFGRHRAMLEFGPGPYERLEIQIGVQRQLDYKPFGEQTSAPVLQSHTPMTAEERAAFDAPYTEEQVLTPIPPLGGMTWAQAKYGEDAGTGTYCPKCGAPQYNTPSGVCCDNGHGAPD